MNRVPPVAVEGTSPAEVTGAVLFTRIILGVCYHADSGAAGLEGGPRVCIWTTLSNDASALNSKEAVGLFRPLLLWRGSVG